MKVEWALNTGYLSVYNVCSADTKTLTQGINIRDKASITTDAYGAGMKGSCVGYVSTTLAFLRPMVLARRTVATGTSQHVSVFQVPPPLVLSTRD